MEIANLLAINSPQLYRPAQPLRDPGHLAFVRRHPCAVCKTRWNVEAAHTGPHGIGQKASDDQTIPLCREHHRTLHRLGRVRFELLFNLDLDSIVQDLKHEFSHA